MEGAGGGVKPGKLLFVGRWSLRCLRAGQRNSRQQLRTLVDADLLVLDDLFLARRCGISGRHRIRGSSAETLFSL